MKKEIIAALILILLFAGTLVNIQVVDKLTGDILALVDESEAAAGRGDLSAAAEKAEAAANMWDGADAYTHILIRHTEIDSTTDAFYELLIQLRSGEAEGAKGAFSMLRAHLNGIAEMEHLSLGSIL